MTSLIDSAAVNSTLELLQPSSSSQRRTQCLSMLAELSTSQEGLELFCSQEFAVTKALIEILLHNIKEDGGEQHNTTIMIILVNISTESLAMADILLKNQSFVDEVCASSRQGELHPTQLLSNLSRLHPDKVHSLLERYWSTFIEDILGKVEKCQIIL